jgi:nucleotide-binding universal stress UspA family protein
LKFRIPRGRRREAKEKAMKRILVGVDGSKESRAAAQFAADLARSMDAQLTIASAIPPVLLTEAAPELVSRAETWAEKEREAARKTMKEIVTALGDGVRVETVLIDGAPAVALAEAAATGGVDLVVVGHRGRNAVTRALLGSVADRLVQICSRPVLVVR